MALVAQMGKNLPATQETHSKENQSLLVESDSDKRAALAWALQDRRVALGPEEPQGKRLS